MVCFFYLRKYFFLREIGEKLLVKQFQNPLTELTVVLSDLCNHIHNFDRQILKKKIKVNIMLKKINTTICNAHARTYNLQSPCIMQEKNMFHAV